MVDTKINKSSAPKKPKNTEAPEKEKKAAAPKVEAPKPAVLNEKEKTEVKQESAKSESSAKPKKVEVVPKAKQPMIFIKQIGSPIRRDPRQKVYLKSLGLGKMNRVRQIVDNASTRGLLDKLQHMVVIIDQ